MKWSIRLHGSWSDIESENFQFFEESSTAVFYDGESLDDSDGADVVAVAILDAGDVVARKSGLEVE